jgi:hypothetical protein
MSDITNPEGGHPGDQRQPDKGPDAGTSPKSPAEQWDALTDEQKNEMRAHIKAKEKQRVGAVTTANDTSFDEKLEIMAPDMQPEIKQAYRTLNHFILEHKTDQGDLSPDDRVHISGMLQGHTQEDATALLQLMGLSDTAITDIVKGLHKNEEDKTEPLPDFEVAKIEGAGEGMENVLEHIETKADRATDELPTGAEFEALPQGEKDEINAAREKIRNHKGKIAALSLKLTDYFAEGEPGRAYARKGKKLLYYILVTTIILLLIESSAIYKAAAGRKGGGR